MDVPKDDVNSQFTFTYDDIKGTVHVVDHQTGEEYDLLKEDTGWFDAEFKFDVWFGNKSNTNLIVNLQIVSNRINPKISEIEIRMDSVQFG